MDSMNKYDCCSFVLNECPMTPSKDEVFYIEAEYDKEVNALIRDNLTFIQDYLWKKYRITFFCLPAISTELMEECIKYHAPYTRLRAKDIPALSTSSILDYLYDPEQRKNIRPGFARVNSSSTLMDGYGPHCVEFNLFYFDVDKYKSDPRQYIIRLCDLISDDTIVCHLNIISWDLVDYQRRSVNEDSEIELDQEGIELSRQIREIARRLYAKGVGEYYIKQLVGSEPILSRLVITKDYRIVLPEFNDMEIVMEPMNKAVYLLFLRHPEGIAFKDLIDYKQELKKIHLSLWTNKEYANIDIERIDKAIDNICSPLSNSINEKTSRIKGLFLKEMHDDIAKHYYITGCYGEPRSITLSQDMIEWQTPDNFNSIERYHIPCTLKDIVHIGGMSTELCHA